MEPLKLQWRRTWADAHNDFEAEDDGLTIGRVYKTHAPDPLFVWYWCCNGYLERYGVWLSDSGREASKDAACRALESAYFTSRDQIRDRLRQRP